ncbi:MULTISPECIES: stage V sporulation protein SpoVM [Psychrobacillus]|nr:MULTISPECIES: stage V sporulation protein SpoVM [Psychrobacillus]MCZ8539493.1 stage V sporulation protein SpoVM [Psychrobacillus psychrodurans]
MFNDKKQRLKGRNCVKVYTFRLPKSVSSFVKVCIRLFKKEEKKK